MNIANRFSIGERVYHVPGGFSGMVTGIIVRPIGLIYMVTWDDGDEDATYEISLSKEKVRDFAD